MAAAPSRPRGQLPPRPHDLRRTLREQRLAAGIAEADVEADVDTPRTLHRQRLRRTGFTTATSSRSARKGRIHAPVFVMPGHAKDSITITVGYGRKPPASGKGWASTLGCADTTRLFSTKNDLPQDTHYDLAVTQEHWAIEGRNLIRSATLEEFKKNPAFVKEMEHDKEGKRISLYADHEYRGQQWGMAIDMNACTGCMACVVACVAENNIPVVGKTQVKTNREMHWLRIDRYFAGDPDSPDVLHAAAALPAVRKRTVRSGCPVATAHSAEGLERHGLQPLRRHALLLEQLPVEGAPLQLPALPGLEHAAVQDAAQPGRHRAQPRRHGEVQLLCAAHQRGAHPVQARGSRDPRRRNRDGLPGGLPDRGDRVRQHQRSEQPRAKLKEPAQLHDARGSQHAPAHDLSLRSKNPEPRVAALNPMVGGHETTHGTNDGSGR